MNPERKNNTKTMKTLLSTLSAIALSLTVMPTTAEAGVKVRIGSSKTYVSGYASCGTPIYTKRVVRGFNRYHKPIYSYHRQPIYRKAATKHYRTPVRHKRVAQTRSTYYKGASNHRSNKLQKRRY